jgi:hypothetical protein
LLFEDASLLQADLVEGLGSTLSINGIQLASRHDRTIEPSFRTTELAGAGGLPGIRTGPVAARQSVNLKGFSSAGAGEPSPIRHRHFPDVIFPLLSRWQTLELRGVAV